MIRQIIICCITGLFILPCHVFAREKQLIITCDMQYAYAEELYQNKDYDTAMVEFKRFVHFFPEDIRRDEAGYKTGMCLYELKKFYDAARVFNEIIIKDRENEITKESVFMQSKAFERIENFGYAQIVLQNYLKLVEDTPTKDRIYFNLARINIDLSRKFESGALQKARHYLLQISPEGRSIHNAGEYSDLITKAEQAPQKNPAAAGLFAIIPGGGFLYCERYKDAAMAFCINAGLMYAAYEAFESDNPALGAIVGLVETGFYTGNIYGSVSSAHKYNSAQKLKILDRQFSITQNMDPINQAYFISLKYEF